MQMSSRCLQTTDDLYLEQLNNNEIKTAVVKQHALPGSMAVWILIYAELSEFALFFLIFLIARAHNLEMFEYGSSQLNTAAGAINTVILLTSSFFVAKAVAAIQAGDQRRCAIWFYLTLAAGATYCGVKVWEYFWNVSAGFDSRTNLFYSTYYYLTFNHFLHVLIGMCVILYTTVRVKMGHYTEEEMEGLEGAACYWHMIDLAWIIIFPLLYVFN